MTTTRVLTTLALLCLSACASTNPITIDPAPYTGPAMTIEHGERTHIATFSMPTGGWGLKFDRSRERFDAHQVFVSIRRPGSDVVTSQSVVEQSLDTRVRLAHKVEVFARMLGDEETAGYRLVPPSRD